MTEFLLAWWLRLAGLSILAVAVAGCVMLPRRHGWAREAARLSPVNREMAVSHLVMIVGMMTLVGLLALLAPGLLLERGGLATVVTGGLAAFWLLRLAIPFVVYSPSHWRGRPAETLLFAGYTLLLVFQLAAFGAAFAWQLTAR